MGFTSTILGATFLSMSTATILPIYIHPHPMLRAIAPAVTKFDSTLKQHIANMEATMLAAKGVGLGATQVGILQQIVLIDRRLGDEERLRDENEKPDLQVYINPEIITQSPEVTPWDMGCLSVPLMFTKVSSADLVTIKYQDETGAEHTEDITGYYAAGVLHEIDHLNGKLFPDHLSRVKRTMFYKKFQKLLPAILQEVTYPVVTAE